MKPETKNPDHTDHWSSMAEQWKQVGQPLRPTTQDIAVVSNIITAWAANSGAPRGLILGVTPELYQLPWPAGSDVHAIDHTPGMIEHVWPGPRDSVACASWINMPLQPGSRDIVLCDGGLHLLSWPQDQGRLVETLQRIITPGGLCIFRLFILPVKREPADQVIEDLIIGRIPNLNILKLRLGMALQETAEEGIKLTQIWNTLHDAAPDLEQLASQINWPLPHLMAINAYRHSPASYHFVTLEQVKTLFCEQPGGFIFESVTESDYELSERCPTVVFRRQPG